MSRAALLDADMVPLEDAVGGAVVLRHFHAGERALHRGDDISRSDLLAMRNWRALVKCQFVEIVPVAPCTVARPTSKRKSAK